jgi:hypothetical protein
MVRPNRPVVRPATVCFYLPRHRRGCPAEPARYLPQRLARNQAAADLFSLGKREPQGPGRPLRPLRLPPAGPMRNAFDSPGRTADFYGHFPNGHALTSKLSGELSLLVGQMRCQSNLPVESTDTDRLTEVLRGSLEPARRKGVNFRPASTAVRRPRPKKQVYSYDHSFPTRESRSRRSERSDLCISGRSDRHRTIRPSQKSRCAPALTGRVRDLRRVEFTTTHIY